jgi:hypothetical protein
MMLSPSTEGDSRLREHARVCGTWSGGCGMSCRCWCHGITKHVDTSLRPDADRTIEVIGPGD